MRCAHINLREKSNAEVIIEYKGKALSYSIYREQEQKQVQVTPSKLIEKALSRPVQIGKRKSYHPQ